LETVIGVGFHRSFNNADIGLHSRRRQWRVDMIDIENCNTVKTHSVLVL